MTTQKFNEAAQQFLARRVPGTKADSLPEAIRPITIEDALMVHQEMIKLRSDSVAGWKCLLPIAEDKMVMAPIFGDTFQSGEQCSLMKDNGVARVEPEIAFVLNKDLPARAEDYSEAEINDAIGSCHMALELMQSRFTEDCTAGFEERLADCLLNQGLYIGPEIDRDLAFAASRIQLSFKQTEANGEVTEQNLDGVHPNPLPQLPVYWAVNFMSKRGTTFKKGEAFTTGSYKGIVEVDFDKKTEISYAGIGSYTVTFKELV
ncbi:hydratase [Colwellia sp. E2M01]|uniref:hydratase n=1 Tax=Colwellia sp. E2M01 TaxID=2841561 RepID=UPI001C09B22C|nr:hydratase [Colwellia sp. E2M01]MBU2871768.1 hydratase [Colwellia sp. E2M01]